MIGHRDISTLAKLAAKRIAGTTKLHDLDECEQRSLFEAEIVAFERASAADGRTGEHHRATLALFCDEVIAERDRLFAAVAPGTQALQ